MAIYLVNNIIDPGQAGDYTAGILSNTASVSAYVAANDIWGGGPGAACLVLDPTHCVTSLDELNACGWYACVQAEANISGDPLFVDPANSDYHLSDGSPCIDAGVDPSPWYDGDLADLDFDGVARPQGAGWDIGAFEFASTEQ